ncbi:MAG: ribbon-helix-helix domain-containing protein [Candidatus Thermoplasmatota archaeon]|nr:ribbon-helix-helix domain-containing protein [Candidatus Thermoplasmatota archaeon]
MRFSKSIISKLYSEGSCLKTTLQVIVKNLYSLDKLLTSLSNDGLINIDVKAFGKNIQEISLTHKGRIVAENLIHLEENSIRIPEGLISEIERIIKKDKSYSSDEEFVNEAVRKAIEKWKMEHAVG